MSAVNVRKDAAGSVATTLAQLAPALVLAAAVAAASFLVGSASPILEGFVITTLIDLVVVVGLYAFVGNSGVLSFGHIAFMALGAYTGAIMSLSPAAKEMLLPGLPAFVQHTQLSAPVATLTGCAVAAASAAVVGWPLMRLDGIAASIATLALLVIVQVVLTHSDSVTGGAQTLTAIPATTTLATAVVWAAGAIGVAWLFQRSAIGSRLRASREDAAAARSVGIGIVGERFVAFVVSAGIAGAGGALYASYLGSLTAASFWFPLTFVTMAMLIVGGIHSLTGAVVGTVVVSSVTQMFSSAGLGPIAFSVPDGVANIVIGVLMLLVLVLLQDGLTGGRELGFRRPRFQVRSR